MQAYLALWLPIAVTVACAAKQSSDAQTPEAVLSHFEGQIARLLQTPQPSLFAWHLRSLRALARAQFAELSLEQENYQRRPLADHRKEFVDYLTTISKGFDGDCADPDCYLKNGTRTLVLAFNSDLDGSLQWAMVDLPAGWDPKTAYPLYIGLHGMGPDNALAYPSFALGPREARPADQKPPSAPVISLTPWGRGNRAWRGDSEHDLWEALDLLKSFARLDPDRWYITGHSAGGDGSWMIVNHTPDLWAAAGMQSGSMIACRPEWGLLKNMAYVPFHILIGEKDPLPHRIPDSKRAYELLKGLKDDTELVIAAGAGHYPLPADALDEQRAWLLKHARKRPARFSFTVDQAQHPGVWGIRLPLNPWENMVVKEPWPHFECSIIGREVRIKTNGIKELSVDLGSNGLQMTGSVKLIVDGKAVFEGPVPDKPVSVKQGK
jgi:predicted esterase